MNEADAGGGSRSARTGTDAGETEIHAGEAVRLIAQIWGLGLTARRLDGARTTRFRLSDAAGGRRLLEIYPATADPTVVAMQAAVLRHVETRDPGLPVPRVIPTPRGDATPVVRLADGRDHPIRMVSFLDGATLDASGVSSVRRRSIGALSARLQTALADFYHPDDDRPPVRDLRRAPSLRPRLARFAGGERDRLERILARFETEIQPELPHLPSQVVHDGLADDDLLVDADDPGGITGIVGLEDPTRAPRLFDLAATCAHRIGDTDDPIAAIGDCLDGYATVIRPTAREAALLPAAILTRLAMPLLVPQWHRRRPSHDRAAVPPRDDPAYRRLERFDRLSTAEIEDRLVAPLVDR